MPQSVNTNTWIIFVDILDVEGDGNLDIVEKFRIATAVAITSSCSRMRTAP